MTAASRKKREEDAVSAVTNHALQKWHPLYFVYRLSRQPLLLCPRQNDTVKAAPNTKLFIFFFFIEE